jgi:hypothetical protein
MVSLLALLVCAKATVDQNGRVTLHELADGLVIPSPASLPGAQFPGPYGRRDQIFFVFYKIIVDTAGTVMLRVVNPSGGELPGEWRDPISPAVGQASTWQSIWALSSGLFQESGWYTLQLWYSGVSVPVASTQLLVQRDE